VVTAADTVGAAVPVVGVTVADATSATITAAAAMITTATDRFSRYDGYAYIDIPPNTCLCGLSLYVYN
jgi:hypothetical protein